jgi:Domain of unknown function (DUF5666)
MKHSKIRTSGFFLAILLLLSSGAALGASAGQWSGTVASVSGDDLTLVGVQDHFRLAGGVTELFSGRSLKSQDLAPGSSVTFRVGAREADGRFRADRTVVQTKNPLTVTGSIDRVRDDRRHVEVHGVEIEVDDNTAFSGRGPSGALRSARDLRAGATVRVTLVPTAAGTLLATDFRPSFSSAEPGEDQEIKGTVTAVSDTAWTIDATVFVITDQTVFRGDPGVGDFVEVKFHTDADGNRIADRIHTEDDPLGIEVEFMGIVEAIGASTWTISGRVVTVDAATVILGTPAVGDTVEVKAHKGQDDTLTALRIKREDAREQEVEFKGAVQSIGNSSWTIAGKVVGVNGATQISGNPAVGDNVEVKANKNADGSLTATRIRKEDNAGQNGDDQGDDHGNDGNSGSGHGNNSGNDDSNDDNGNDVHGGHHGGSDDPTGHN